MSTPVASVLSESFTQYPFNAPLPRDMLRCSLEPDTNTNWLFNFNIFTCTLTTVIQYIWCMEVHLYVQNIFHYYICKCQRVTMRSHFNRGEQRCKHEYLSLLVNITQGNILGSTQHWLHYCRKNKKNHTIIPGAPLRVPHAVYSMM